MISEVDIGRMRGRPTQAVEITAVSMLISSMSYHVRTTDERGTAFGAVSILPDRDALFHGSLQYRNSLRLAMLTFGYRRCLLKLRVHTVLLDPAVAMSSSETLHDYSA